MMRGVAVELPEGAREKLLALQLARGAAEDAARSASARLNNLRDAEQQQMRDALAAEQSKQQHRFGQLSQLLSRVNQWLVELRGVALEVAPPVSVDLKLGETLSGAVEAARVEIKAVRERLQAVRSAPLPASDQKKLAEKYVVRLMRAARPTIGIVRDTLKVSLRGDMVAAEDVLALMTWAAPEQVLRAIEREIEQQPARADAMPANERMRRVAELELQVLELEQREENLIMQAAAAGQEVLRRPDASPLAVLNCVIVKAQVQQVA